MADSGALRTSVSRAQDEGGTSSWVKAMWAVVV